MRSSDLDSRVDASESGGLRPHEFFVIRYVPNLARGEFINIGVVLREAATDDVPGQRRAAVRITRDWTRLYRMFADADIELLEHMENQFEQWLRNVVTDLDNPVSEFDKKLEELSLTVQMTDAQACMAADMDAHLQLLMHMYVDDREALPDSSKWIVLHHVHSAVRGNPFMRQVGMKGVAPYVGEGDTLVFDFMWSSKDTVHIIHGLPLDIQEGLSNALALVQRMDKLREGVLRVEGKPLELTVVVEPRPGPGLYFDHARAQYDYIVDKMREAGIRVITIQDLPQYTQALKEDIIPTDDLRGRSTSDLQ